MDAKITKKRLGHLLSYDWIKILITAVVAVMVWSIVFTMTATRITTTQRFVVSNYLGISYDKLKLDYGVTKEDSNGVFSYEILEGEAIDNLRGGTSTFNDLFRANMEVSEGDVMMVADAPMSRTAVKDEQGNEVKDAEGNVQYEYGETYLNQLLGSYSTYFTRLDDAEGSKGYFTQMKEYLGRFYPILSETVKVYDGVSLTQATFDKTSMDEAAVEAAFRARVKQNKDKRFKKESQIVEGIAKEKERIRSYAEAYDTFFSYLDGGYVQLTTVSVKLTEQITLTGAYGINLCPGANSTMKNLKEQIYYTNFEGTDTAENINALFLNFKDLDKDFQYENLLYLNALIKDVCTEL